MNHSEMNWLFTHIKADGESIDYDINNPEMLFVYEQEKFIAREDGYVLTEKGKRWYKDWQKHNSKQPSLK